jgi:hypothetical protein
LNILSSIRSILSAAAICTFFIRLLESTVLVSINDFGIDEINQCELNFYPVPLHKAIEVPYIL